MNLEKIYKMQEELDKYIIKNRNIVMSKEELLDNTILALLVEVGELANTTRCFKHWSTKGIMDKEIVLDELADVIHFYLSIGNQIGSKYKNNWIGDWLKTDLTFSFLILYANCGEFGNECSVSDDLSVLYQRIGNSLTEIIYLLDFTDEELEQAYLKKHEENYKRQREGY